VAAPAARHGGRRGLCAGEVRAAPTNWGRLGARVWAGKGGEQLVLVRSRPKLVARRGGHLWRHGCRAGGGGEERGLARCRGVAPLYGGQGSTVTYLGARTGLGRSEW
jgi:hypothetical protein